MTTNRRLFENISRIFGGGGGGREEAWLIAGLGNPGAAYQATRHNVGFMAADAIAGTLGIAIKKNKLSSLIGEGVFEGRKIVLFKPQTYMNLSGEAVRRVMRFYKAPPERLIVIYDDVDIALGAIRLRAFGGPGSHNGMRSIADHLGDGAKFPRIRIGIGGERPQSMELSEYVLKRFTQEEKEIVGKAVEEAAAAALDVVRHGVERAMNAHNPKRR